MSYPVWEVPNIGNGWIIGLIAIFHVFISHFAIGGGAFLALTETLAYKKNDDRIYEYIKKHSKFFLLLTTVLGAVSGVGIWWAIGLANPSGASVLIQNFGLFWGAEWTFFAAELATFLAYYYTMGKMDKKNHCVLAWIYFGISFGTLFVINGILTGMLTNGGWLNAQGNIVGTVYDSFFNPAFWPALAIRLFIMFALAGIYALLTASTIKGQDDLKQYLLRYSAKWMLPGLIAGPLFVVWYMFTLPPATQQVIVSGLSSLGEGNFSMMAKVIFLCIVFATGLIGMVIVGPFLNPKGFNTTFALMLLASGFGFMFTEEWSREMMRKPYVIYNYMYSNGLRKNQIAQVNADGFFKSNAWARAEGATLAKEDTVGHGKLMFRYQCMSCHTATGNGYRSMARLLGERDENAIANLITLMKDNHVILSEESKDEKGNTVITTKAKTPYNGYMPPVVGHQDELDALSKYLVTLSKKGMEAGAEKAEAQMATESAPQSTTTKS
jgi:mono/diheme cytochrome c family protein